jgi:hypothetical protein
LRSFAILLLAIGALIFLIDSGEGLNRLFNLWGASMACEVTDQEQEGAFDVYWPPKWEMAPSEKRL